MRVIQLSGVLVASVAARATPEGWLMVTGRLRPAPDYLVADRPYLGEIAARHHRAFHGRFCSAADGLGQ
jgi:hypothetical protein